ncbi:hypothetical protein [Streptomyces sp. NPDC007369]|uniref:hypothetical protein n=1 Tax=Streptomyces sp. NPDC007369 TaxID=3154589 RepID=UPI0033CBA149
MNMPGCLRSLCASLLLVPALSACGLVPQFASCEGTDAALAELAKVPMLELRPDGATPLGGGAAPAARCVEDTAGAWLTAGRLYAYSGSRTEVLEYYGRVAPAAGWRPVHDLDVGPDGRMAVFCFESRSRPSVTLAFNTAQELREFHDLDPGPEADGSGPRTWFSLSAEADTDGSRMGCFG